MPAIARGTGTCFACEPPRAFDATALEYVGKYFFADFRSGWINTLDVETGAVATFASGISSPVDLKVTAGTLSASAFTWRIDFHHDTHVHPFIAPFSGVTSGSFTIPRTGETSANVWYRIVLTVTDSAGQSTTAIRDVHPRTVAITLSAQRNGIWLTLDGQPVPAVATTYTARYQRGK